MSRYRIKVTQLPCEDTALLAPPGCLTYNTDLAGTISSFNYADGAGELLNNQAFSHCIKYHEGYCDVSLLASEFDLGENHDTGDSLLIGSTFLTGNNFGVDGTLLCMKNIFNNKIFILSCSGNFTGSYYMRINSDEENYSYNVGYKISYLLLPCDY